MADFITMNDIIAELAELIEDLEKIPADIRRASVDASAAAAEVIAAEQRRVMDRATFKRDRNRHYKFVDSSLISVSKSERSTKLKTVMNIGFDTKTIRDNPELIEIEFGRPGKSPRHSGKLDKLGRRKGDFPASAQVMPIRAGYQAAREKVLARYRDIMFNTLERRFGRG